MDSVTEYLPELVVLNIGENATLRCNFEENIKWCIAAATTSSFINEFYYGINGTITVFGNETCRSDYYYGHEPTSNATSCIPVCNHTLLYCNISCKPNYVPIEHYHIVTIADDTLCEEPTMVEPCSTHTPATCTSPCEPSSVTTGSPEPSSVACPEPSSVGLS